MLYLLCGGSDGVEACALCDEEAVEHLEVHSQCILSDFPLLADEGVEGGEALGGGGGHGLRGGHHVFQDLVCSGGGVTHSHAGFLQSDVHVTH